LFLLFIYEYSNSSYLCGCAPAPHRKKNHLQIIDQTFSSKEQTSSITTQLQHNSNFLLLDKYQSHSNGLTMIGSLYFLKLGHEIVGCKPHAYRLCGARDKFMSLYGTEPQVAALVWDMLPDDVKNKNGCHPKHLLWTLNFLKAYDTAINHATRFHCDEKTFRNWTWYMLEFIERLHSQVVSSTA